MSITVKTVAQSFPNFVLFAIRLYIYHDWANMHFALPPRKTSQPPPYARASRKTSYFRQQQLRLVGYIVCGILTIYLLFHYVSFSDALVESAPPGTAPVVIVTVLDEQHMSDEYIKKIRTNREDYAARQGQRDSLQWLARYCC